MLSRPTLRFKQTRCSDDVACDSQPFGLRYLQPLNPSTNSGIPADRPYDLKRIAARAVKFATVQPFEVRHLQPFNPSSVGISTTRPYDSNAIVARTVQIATVPLFE
eukprot:10335909-Alexandrium_andersonii.AAC.1